jgi:hypothetical protein
MVVGMLISTAPEVVVDQTFVWTRWIFLPEWSSQEEAEAVKLTLSFQLAMVEWVVWSEQVGVMVVVWEVVEGLRLVVEP